MRRYIVPVYDHVLMTEPLTSEQLEAIGWADRAGLNDSGHQFHYYRRTHDDRILWGGYDANYYFGNGMGPEYEDRRSSHELIARHFFETFPQLGRTWLLAPLGRPDRHDQQVRSDLRNSLRRAAFVGRWVHRAWCRGKPVRGPRCA